MPSLQHNMNSAVHLGRSLPPSHNTNSAVHLGRSLPYARRADPYLFDEEAFPARPRDHSTPYAVPQPARWDFAPFGKQKADPEPAAPFRMAPAADKPQVEPPLEEIAEPERVRPTPRAQFYAEEEDLGGQDLGPTRRGAAVAGGRARRLGRSVYDAMQTHGHFGLVDGGETLSGGVRRVVVHVPKRNRGYALDLRPGEVVHANSARGTQARGRLDVLFVSRHKYVSPGHAVTSCVIGVPEEQWSVFVD